MLKNVKSAQIIHFHLSAYDEKKNSYWICKYSWSITQLTGYSVTALQHPVLNLGHQNANLIVSVSKQISICLLSSMTVTMARFSPIALIFINSASMVTSAPSYSSCFPDSTVSTIVHFFLSFIWIQHLLHRNQSVFICHSSPFPVAAIHNVC